MVKKSNVSPNDKLASPNIQRIGLLTFENDIILNSLAGTTRVALSSAALRSPSVGPDQSTIDLVHGPQTSTLSCRSSTFDYCSSSLKESKNLRTLMEMDSSRGPVQVTW